MELDPRSTSNVISVLPMRNDYHWRRRIFHMASGTFFAFLSFQFARKNDFILFMLILTLAEVGFEVARLKIPFVGGVAIRIFGQLMRTGEQNRFSGIPYYLAGITFSFLLFPRPIAVMAVLYLAYGDPIGSIAARYFRSRGETREVMPNRTWAGTLSAGAICLFITLGMSFILFPNHSFFVGERLMLAFVGGVCAAIGESLPLRTDDNLSLPLVAASLLWLYASFTGLVPGLVN